MALNGEGVQKEKLDIIKFIPKGKSILDLGCGITTPYANALITRDPYFITFLDIRFKNVTKNNFSERLNIDALEYLEDKFFGVIWASEFMEHLEHDVQLKMMEKIKKCCTTYIITFPTINHFNFHNDPSHISVIIPHLAYKVNGRDWEGIITNNDEIVRFLKTNYKTEYYNDNPKIYSKKRPQNFHS